MPSDQDTIYKKHSPLSSDNTTDAQPLTAESSDATIVRPSSSLIQEASSVIETVEALSPDTYKVGHVLANRYILVRKLGAGGTSDVYKARDTLMEENDQQPIYVAVKILNRSADNYFDVVKMMRREAVKTRSLHHPNIVRVHDFCCDKKTYFIVMELLEGESLDEMIKRARPTGLSGQHAFNIAEKVASALHYAHQKGIVHSDLKPSNIYLTKEKVVKLLDFGVARRFHQPEEESVSMEDVISIDDDFTGYTPAYASIELIQGKTATVKDDVYSFGCIIYEMLTSQHPYDRLPADKAKQDGKSLVKVDKLTTAQWHVLQSMLSLSAQQRSGHLGDAYTELSQTNQKTKLMATAVVASMLVIAAGLFGYHQYSQQQELREKQLRFDQEKEQRFMSLVNTPPATVLDIIPTIASLENPEKSLLMQSQRQPIIDAAIDKADRTISDAESDHYLNAITIIEGAESLYPDSHTLALKKQGLTTAFEQIKANTVNTLDQAFIEPSYDSEKGRADITELLSELNTLDSTFAYVPNNEARQVFEGYTQVALDSHLFDRIVVAKQIGEMYFPENSTYKALLAKGKLYLNAAENLHEYQVNIAAYPGLPFPDDDMRVLFGDEYKALIASVESANLIAEIQAADESVMAFLSPIPENSAIATELRGKLASAYLRIGSNLLAKRYNRSARTMLARAEELDDKN